ncbi:hypothetical protein A9Q99_24945 [Gammaproteobacteria bacterium 45_16_T64]|nr:hypothetical protein A9Q99_24945 [Gammaproteobacteria bacterium 45_16_T64]
MKNSNFNDDIGLALVGMVDDQYVVELMVEERHKNVNGTVHGGVLCTILDAAMARAYFGSLPEEKRLGVTLEMKINFLKPSTAGKLVGYGVLTNGTRRTGFVEGVIKNEAGQLVAKASGTMMLLAQVEA